MSEMADRYHALNAEVFPWFLPQWQRVLSLFDQNRLPHALLLNGAPGIGKARLAESIAGYVMCHQPVDSKACGHCRSCELLASSGHPDLYYLQPDEAGKAIKVDQVRELTEFMQNTAQQGGYRVVVTMADATSKAVRFESVLAPGQSVVLSSPAGVGKSPARVEISRAVDSVNVQARPLTN